MDRKERTTMEDTIRDHARRLIIRAAARLVEMENMNAPDHYQLKRLIQEI